MSRAILATQPEFGVEDFAGAVALVLSVALAGVAGDALATRLWDPARFLV